MIRVRKVNGGGSNESGSKNCIARYKRAYLKKYSQFVIIVNCTKFFLIFNFKNEINLLPLCVKSVVHFSVGDCKHHNQNPETLSLSPKI